MALKSSRADSFTRSELGPRRLEELSRNLWLGNCQSCGSNLGTDVPAVVIVDDGSFSVDIEDFAGRRDLVHALTQRNIMVFTQEQLDEVLRLPGRD